jgi:glycosyltransferase involved in cell wall biosynthesis
MRRLLLVLPQLPQDPTSGAARSMLSICEMLSAWGYQVRCLATTATEGRLPCSAMEHLERMGVFVVGSGAELHLTRRGISFRLLTAEALLPHIDRHFRSSFDSALREEIVRFRPDVMFLYTWDDFDGSTFAFAREYGARIIYGLRNYLHRSASCLRQADAILTPTNTLSAYYQRTLGIRSTAIAPIICEEDTLPLRRTPTYLTFVNPTPSKGVAVMARIIEQLGISRPDIRVQVIEARGTEQDLVNCGLRAGFNLLRHESLTIRPCVPDPKVLFESVRILLVPSLQEAAARVVAEAMLNGIPVLVSNRGGLPELVCDKRFVVRLPEGISTEQQLPVSRAVVKPWINHVIRLTDDPDYYCASARRIAELGRAYRTENLLPRYLRFFEDILSSPVLPAFSECGFSP